MRGRSPAFWERYRVSAPTIDIAQPRWVGPKYWRASPRVVLLLLNPGSGDGYNDESDRTFRQLLVGFRDGTTPLADVLSHQAHDMPNWGQDRFVSFYMGGLGLQLDRIAFANVAWCATRGNQYPSAMLQQCFDRFTRRLLDTLSPSIVLISGSSAHQFHEPIQRQLPDAKVLSVLHYAHRKGQAAQEQEIRRISQQLATSKARSG